MPKKIKENPKAVEARARKEADKAQKKAAKDKATEDAKWTDEGSTAAERRKAEKFAKSQEDAAKRAAKKALVEADDASLKAKAKKPEKLTHVKILSLAEQREAEAAKQAKEDEMCERRIVRQIDPEENPNQRAAAEHRDDLKKFAGGVVSASGVDEVLANFSAQSIGKSEEFNVAGGDKHPEKRMKAAFAEYEERQMAVVKAEHPTLKLSQLRELIWKSWQKAPENPMNAAAAAGAGAAGAAGH